MNFDFKFNSDKATAKLCFFSPDPILKIISSLSLSLLIPLQSLASVESLKGKKLRKKLSNGNKRK